MRLKFASLYLVLGARLAFSRQKKKKKVLKKMIMMIMRRGGGRGEGERIN